MNLGEFFKKYSGEEPCIEVFKTKRLKMGLICKKHQHTLQDFS